MALIECPECGKKISDKAMTCPSCGCPIISSDINKQMTDNDNETIQQKEYFEHTKNKSEQSKKRIIVLLIVLVVVSITTFFVKKKIEDNIRIKEYKERLDEVNSIIFSSSITAEREGILIHDVWYNTIYEVDDKNTDKYTKDLRGNFYDDFNDSLSNLMSDYSFSKSISSIKESQSKVQELMKELVNPPDKYKEEYSALRDYYDAYFELTNLVIEPQGSLTTFTTNFENAINNFVKAYNAMELYLD
ncbi:MAG: zinc ribbon domain-containing protein [Lachnospiraceae bacterium]|nr:zinc ribbon domain-containing protein [Lachnospiraceae bacterium]